MKYAEQFFDEVWVTFISILVMLKREDEALHYIDEIKTVSEYFKMELITTKLNMIQASIQIQNGFVDKAKKLIVQIEKYFKKCSKHSRDGVGEAYVLKALYKIAEYQQRNSGKEVDNLHHYSGWIN